MADFSEYEKLEGIVKVLETEMECVKRQDKPKCPRLSGKTCAVCDLITDTSKVLEAYQGAIDTIKHLAEEERKKAMKELAKEEAEEAWREALEEAHRLDDNEGTIAGRWHL